MNLFLSGYAKLILLPKILLLYSINIITYTYFSVKYRILSSTDNSCKHWSTFPLQKKSLHIIVSTGQSPCQVLALRYVNCHSLGLEPDG